MSQKSDGNKYFCGTAVPQRKLLDKPAKYWFLKDCAEIKSERYIFQNYTNTATAWKLLLQLPFNKLKSTRAKEKSQKLWWDDVHLLRSYRIIFVCLPCTHTPAQAEEPRCCNWAKGWFKTNRWTQRFCDWSLDDKCRKSNHKADARPRSGLLSFS